MSTSDFPDRIKKGISQSLSQLRHTISEFLSTFNFKVSKEIFDHFSLSKEDFVVKRIIF